MSYTNTEAERTKILEDFDILFGDSYVSRSRKTFKMARRLLCVYNSNTNLNSLMGRERMMKLHDFAQEVLDGIVADTRSRKSCLTKNEHKKLVDICRSLLWRVGFLY